MAFIVGNKAKGRFQNGCFKKTKHAKFSEKQTFLTTDKHMYMCVSWVRNVRFWENLACFVFLKHTFSDSPFCLITDVFRFIHSDSTDTYSEPCQTSMMKLFAKIVKAVSYFLKIAQF